MSEADQEGAQATVDQTRDWIERFVIGLGLCPFAAAPFNAGRIHYAVCRSGSGQEQRLAFLAELQRLIEAEPEEIETSLLICPVGLSEFDAYLDRLGELEALLVEAGAEGIVQVASFHPDYRFDGVDADDPANFTNRSPYPMFHLLREQGLEKAIANHPDPEGIPARNVARLRALGIDGIDRLLAGLEPRPSGPVPS